MAKREEETVKGLKAGAEAAGSGKHNHTTDRNLK
jgi:hypothetical protein